MKGGTGCSSTGVYPYVICEDRAKKLDEFEDNVTLLVERAKRFQSSLFQRSKFEFFRSEEEEDSWSSDPKYELLGNGTW